MASVDVAVVGGGPGGLSSALYLARFRRTVVVLDDGASRARRIPWSHNYPGFAGGVAGAALLDAMHLQATRHGVASVRGRVDRIERRAGGGYSLHWPGGTVRARMVVIATGASDIEPEMPQLATALHQGALRYCPVCDGFEVIDQAVAVVADGAGGAAEALFLRRFTRRVSLFFTGPRPALAAAQRRALADADVAMPGGALLRLGLHDGRIELVQGGASSHFDTVYCALGMRVHSDLAARLGAGRDAEGYLLVDGHQRTTVPGLYAVGDVAAGLNQISVATGGAATAASAVHLALPETLAR